MTFRLTIRDEQVCFGCGCEREQNDCYVHDYKRQQKDNDTNKERLHAIEKGHGVCLRLYIGAALHWYCLLVCFSHTVHTQYLIVTILITNPEVTREQSIILVGGTDAAEQFLAAFASSGAVLTHFMETGTAFN